YRPSLSTTNSDEEYLALNAWSWTEKGDRHWFSYLQVRIYSQVRIYPQIHISIHVRGNLS
ncbi:MAG: hypothetical protein F6K09_37135, partial [Merismopedia sp. SIO2A8]|nr:hypothetical protein [Merismopedia sp. SIO2A8]